MLFHPVIHHHTSAFSPSASLSLYVFSRFLSPSAFSLSRPSSTQALAASAAVPRNALLTELIASSQFLLDEFRRQEAESLAAQQTAAAALTAAIAARLIGDIQSALAASYAVAVFGEVSAELTAAQAAAVALVAELELEAAQVCTPVGDRTFLGNFPSRVFFCNFFC